MKKAKEEDLYSPEEAARRFEAFLKMACQPFDKKAFRAEMKQRSEERKKRLAEKKKSQNK